MIQPDRLWGRIQEVGKIGRQESGGVTRLAFSPEERSAKELVSSFMKEAGLAVREDEAGNLIGRREGTLPDAPAVLIGSHLDSVYNGGDFDGPLGVLAGVEVLQAIQEQGIQVKHPIEVIAFTDEEGARFSFGMLGSRALAGTVKSTDLANRDQTGTAIADAMAACGLSPERLSAAKRSPESVKAYVELHIEQGKVLEANGLSVGIVTGIAGPLWLKFTVEGEAGHAGTTPMNLRHDPLSAAGKIMTAIEEEASASGTAVGTVGQLQVFPGGINIIPKRVEFSLDLRDIDESVRDRVEQKILQRAAAICEQAGVHLQTDLLQRVPPVPCSHHVLAAAEAAFETAGFQPFRLISGAGHDGMQLKDLCPIGMIFVRSKDGISHNPAEWSSQADCADGAKALYYTVLKLAQA